MRTHPVIPTRTSIPGGHLGLPPESHGFRCSRPDTRHRVICATPDTRDRPEAGAAHPALSGGLGDSVEPPVSRSSSPSTSSTREWGAETIEELGEGVSGTCAGSGGVLGGRYEKRCIGHQPEQ